MAPQMRLPHCSVEAMRALIPRDANAMSMREVRLELMRPLGLVVAYRALIPRDANAMPSRLVDGEILFGAGFEVAYCTVKGRSRPG